MQTDTFLWRNCLASRSGESSLAVTEVVVRTTFERFSTIKKTSSLFRRFAVRVSPGVFSPLHQFLRAAFSHILINWPIILIVAMNQISKMRLYLAERHRRSLNSSDSRTTRANRVRLNVALGLRDLFGPIHNLVKVASIAGKKRRRV